MLRDVPECNNPFQNSSMRFHYLKTLPPWWGRLKLAFSLLVCLLQRPPHHIFFGHIKLATLVFSLCKFLGIPYTISTHGKEVWETLPWLEQPFGQLAVIVAIAS